MKLSDLDKSEYQFTNLQQPQSGGISSSIPSFIPGSNVLNKAITPLSRIGATFGAEIGKAGLGLGETLLKGGQSLAGKISPEMAKTFEAPIKATQNIKKGVFETPFEQEKSTISGKFGQFLGISAPFVAGTPAITRGQGILANILQPVKTVKGLGTLSQAASQAVPEALVTGATQFGISGGDKEGAKEAAMFAGAGSAGFSALGSLARATFFPELKNSVTRALGIQGKTTGGLAEPLVDKKIAGLSVLNKYAPEIKVKDAGGIEKNFKPTEATFDETLQAWNTARKNIYSKYHAISSQLSKSDFVDKAGETIPVGIDVEEVANNLNAVINSPRTSPYKDAARSILKDLVENFGEVKNGAIKFKKTAPDQIESFLSDLYVPASSIFQGKGDRAYAEIAAGASRGIRNLLDNAIESAAGPQYTQLRSEYSALKSIEDDLVRRFQQEARQLGGGLSDYANIFSSGDIIAGVISQNPQFIAKGLGQNAFITFLKKLKQPNRYLQRAFKLLDKSDASGISQRLFGGAGGRALTEQDQKMADTIKNYIKKPKLGMSIEDVSKTDPLLSEARKYKSADEFVRANNKGKALVYHRTNANPDDLLKGFLSKENTEEAFVSNKIKGQAEGYGKNVVPVWIDKKKLRLDDEFPSGEKHFAISQKEITDALKTKSQLIDIWNKANKTTPEVYAGEKDLTTKILKDLEGKSTVSKQYILDATNRGELKQSERDIIREALQTEGDTVKVKDFAEKVKAELLPLTRRDDLESSAMGGYKYENITLPDELRGNVENYAENIYESPIKTSAGETGHYPEAKNYFGHTRIEDMADDTTRRVIEVQSDLYQKGGLEREATLNPKRGIDADAMQRLEPLQQYNNPTAHFRMIREEVRQAAQDGKTKLQFPTGETAMKIEGLGNGQMFTLPGAPNVRNSILQPSQLKTGLQVEDIGRNQWIITDVLGDGKFKAVPKKFVEMQPSNWEYSIDESMVADGGNPAWMAYNEKTGQREFIQFIPSKKEEALQHLKDRIGKEDKSLQELAERYGETFDISGKVDTENPIYKFYEKEVGKYLKNKYNAQLVTDDNGVKWWEVKINKQMAKMPVEAFGLAPLLANDNENE